MTEIDNSAHSGQHYARLAASYNLLWDHTPEFREWMARHILEYLVDDQMATVVDVGGGTGIYAAELLRLAPNLSGVTVVDPSAEMLGNARVSDRLHTVQADAEHANDALAKAGVATVDLVLIKEAVHHFADPPTTLRKLVRLVGDSGSIVVVMLPTRIRYPLFDAALTRFTERQPDPRTVEAALSGAGLKTSIETHGFEISLPTERWIQMLENRFMSLLSTFDDEELERGVAEVADRYRGITEVRFVDEFAFVHGSK